MIVHKSVAERRDKFRNAGKSATSWEKHWLMAKALRPQVGKACMRFGRAGVIVDMHAHDGEGVNQPQGDLFDEPLSKSSAAIAVEEAEHWKLDVVLCESQKGRRDALMARFQDRATYLSSFNRLTKDVDWDSYEWAVVMNDPCGHGSHGVNVLEYISRLRSLRSDFIISLNISGLLRHVSLPEHGENDDEYPNASMVKGSRASAAEYLWMQYPDAWRQRLNKRHVAYSAKPTPGKGYRGQILVVSNSLANLNRNYFTWYR